MSSGGRNGPDPMSIAEPRMVDLDALARGARRAVDLALEVTMDDLRRLTEEMCDLQLSLVANLEDADVSFVPEDPEANDTHASSDAEVDLPWTLGHVIGHATASSEEAAAMALTLARGLPVTERSRKEVPWPTITTAAQVRHRIGESRRMRLAMLAAWPDRPDLEITYQPRPERPPMNAIARFIGGLQHDHSHLDQIREIVRQARQTGEVGAPGR